MLPVGQISVGLELRAETLKLYRRDGVQEPRKQYRQSCRVTPDETFNPKSRDGFLPHSATGSENCRGESSLYRQP